MKLIKSSDFIGQSIIFYINKKQIHQTLIGGILSFLICLLTLIAGIYFGVELWQRNNPIVNTAIDVDNSPSELVLDKITWDLFFGLQYNNVLFIDETIYTIKGRLFTYSNNDLNFKYFNIERCTNESFSNYTLPMFTEFFFTTSWCVSKKQDFPIQLNKLWGQEGFSYIDISIWPCINGSDLNPGIVCAPQDEINRVLKQGTFSIYTTLYYFQSKNFLSPYTMAIFNDFYSVSMNTLSQISIFLGHTNTLSDIGWLFQDNISYSRFFLDRVKTNFYLTPENDGRFLRFQFELTNLVQINTRKYLKIQELAAQVGGVANLLFILSLILNYFISQFYLQEYLVNKFFDLPIKEGSEIINVPAQKPNKQDSILGIKNDVLTINKIPQNKQNPNLEPLDTNPTIPSLLYIPQRNKLEFTIFQKVFFFCLDKKRNNIRQLKESFKLLRDHLSVENFLETTKTVSKLRYFLLSNYENDLLDKIGNPTIDYNYNNKKDTFSKMSSFIHNNYSKDENEIIEYQIDRSFFNMGNEVELRRLNRFILAYNSRPKSLRPFGSENFSVKAKFLE